MVKANTQWKRVPNVNDMNDDESRAKKSNFYYLHMPTTAAAPRLVADLDSTD